MGCTLPITPEIHDISASPSQSIFKAISFAIQAKFEQPEQE